LDNAAVFGRKEENRRVDFAGRFRSAQGVVDGGLRLDLLNWDIERIPIVSMLL
jgi:hypothetical protein